jgi:ubiquinone/menaquinone biosynthesis C-methylase UbiE
MIFMKIGWKRLEQDWRRQLLSHAKGNILEVGVETGVNFDYYPAGVQVIATDQSERVISKARAAAKGNGVQASFIVSSPDTLQLPERHFDTIVSTFSLSAYEDPSRVLNRFNEWCKPDGTILLLEYGLSKYGMVNWLQRKWGAKYHKRTGYHVDRDILGIISESRLRLKRVEIKYVGTVYMVWAALKPG